MPVVRDAGRSLDMKHSPYRIIAWKHDGFPVKARLNTVQDAERLKRLVRAEARRIRVPTGLGADWL